MALKILKAGASRNNEELSMLLNLSTSDLGYPGKAHVTEMLDHFHHMGPNESHLCLVLSDDMRRRGSDSFYSVVFRTKQDTYRLFSGESCWSPSDIFHCGKPTLHGSYS